MIQADSIQFEDFDEFRELWTARADGVFELGLRYICSLDELPCPDGVFSDFVRRLAGFARDLSRYAAALVDVLNKDSPYLQEAGVELSRALLAWKAGWFPDSQLPENLEAALLARMHAPDLDDWVAEALFDFLEAARVGSVPLRSPAWRDAVTIFVREQERRRAQSKAAGARTDFAKLGIMRNRAIFPEQRGRSFLASLSGET